ncbi:MAG: hypothetical protein KBC05_10540 [Candidatus Hydrogenedentes bacterium]|nr:hypothetical protein [Candidatus Hydrogenedentota bacterium]
MNFDTLKNVESLQRLIARTVAVHPAGRRLLLIGGFRYRFLDESIRASDDIDYHWSGSLQKKQAELLSLFKKILLPEVRRRLHYEGTAAPRTGPVAESPAVRIVDLAFWRADEASSRIEIPVEITRVRCADPVEVRTAGGAIYPTASEADMIESKVIAMFNRPHLQHRDIVDFFLFRDRLSAHAHRRLAAKFRALGLTASAVEKRMADFRQHAAYHARAIQAVMDAQVEPSAATQIHDAGGGKMVFQTILPVLSALVSTAQPKPTRTVKGAKT